MYDRIRGLEGAGVVARYVAVVDKRRVAPRTQAFCEVTLHRQSTAHVDAFAAAVREHAEVLDCYVIGGAYDLLLRIACADLRAYYGFVTGTVSALPNVASTRSSFVIEEVKASTAWPVG